MKVVCCFIVSAICMISCLSPREQPAIVDEYNIVWDSPCKYASGSMPLGNGDIGVNAWVEESGDLLFYIGKTDAWSENGRLLKLGKVRVRFTPNLIAPDLAYHQELQFRKGQWVVRMGNEKNQRTIEMWVDANRPVIHVEVDSDKKFEAIVSLEPWRTKRRKAKEEEMHSFYSYNNSGKDIFIEPDVIVEGTEDQIVWCHHNIRSVYEETMTLQALDPLIDKSKDPLLHRTFGGLIRGNDFIKVNSTTLKSAKKKERSEISVFLLTTEKYPIEEWQKKLEEIAEDIETVSLNQAKKEHHVWWNSFWNRSWVRVSGGDTTETRNISLGWHANRYLSACTGRGAFPVKFNGSIFNVDGDGITQRPGNMENWDADYRRWGDPFWFQNERQIYWPMLSAGDYDMMMPFFRMYFNILPLAKKRTELYYGHEGAFFPETQLFYGPYANANYGWDRKGKPDGLTDNRYIRRYWQGGLELSLMMLDYYHYTGDSEFFKDTALPVITEVITFFFSHWPLDQNGEIEFYPAQALETYWDVKNPLPEIAGLKKVLSELLVLPENVTTEQQRIEWQRFLTICPDLPVKTDEQGKTYMSSALEVFADSRNKENVALYSVFPYRLFGVGRADLEMMSYTYEKRAFTTVYSCWHNNNVFAAYLGLADEARIQLADRYVRSGEYRYPAFYVQGDWVPDHDNGGVAQQAIQAMLLQPVNDKLYLFPAWPKEWDVNFKLHGPQNTTIEGEIRNGEIVDIEVIPSEREKDIVICLE